ncbi:MAG: hypothetical protein AAF235_01130 [Planctomycetota bacterium]
MNALEKLRSVVNDLKANTDHTKTQPNWDLAGRLASRFPVDAARLTAALRAKDLAELDAMVLELEGKSAPAPEAEHSIDKATLDHALAAFKKRLKLGRLADESTLGGRYTSGGKQSKIDAIIAPSEFPKEVWDALVQEGRLEYTGQGFYKLA